MSGAHRQEQGAAVSLLQPGSVPCLARRWPLTAFTTALAAGVLVLSTRLPAVLDTARGPRELDALLPLIIVLTPGFLVYSCVRMETMLFSGLLVLLLLVQCRSPRSVVATSLLSLAVVLTRPEGILYIAALGVARLLNQQLKITADYLAWGGIIAAGTSVALTCRRLYYGAWLPNPYYAKIAQNPGHNLTPIYCIDWLQFTDLGGLNDPAIGHGPPDPVSRILVATRM